MILNDLIILHSIYYLLEIGLINNFLYNPFNFMAVVYIFAVII